MPDPPRRRPNRSFNRLWPLAVLLLLVAGCAPAAPPPLPTLRPVAEIPTAGATPPAVPATFTPVLDLPGDTAVSEPTPSPTIVLTPAPQFTPTPTRDVIPTFLLGIPDEAVFLETPPQSLDCGQYGLLFRSRFPSIVGGPWRDYHAYLPPCYGEDGRSYPVLYLFHGSIQTDSHWVDLGLVAHVEAGIRTGRYPPFIIIMPSNGEIGNNTSGNTHSIEGITVNALIPYVDEAFCTWADAPGRSIGGISRGGYWALMIAFRHPELFTAVGGHSSHLRLETDAAVYNPLVTYAEADLSNMRIWMDWGETDFLRTGQQQLRSALESIDANLTATVNGGGHNDRYWQVHLREYLDWYTAEWPADRSDYPLCDR